MTGSETQQAEVLIIGGAMVGLTLGCALAGAGIEVTVIDRADPAAQLHAGFDGRASAIAHGTKQALDGIGVWPAMAPHAEPIRESRVSDGDASLFLHYDHRDLGGGRLTP